jgi:catalase-peroxidase
MGDYFDYVEEFNNLDLAAVKADIVEVMHTSQSWWPADYGHYGPLFIRMAWHSAGTYRTTDGRGGGGQGLQRFAPLNSWPDNVNLDKARRLLWPVKKKYGRSISWADLMILAGNVALEDMGFPTFGFAGGRADVWEPDNTYWGNETEWLASKRYDTSRDAETLEDPLAAVQMGLIYVNPEGPDGNPDFKLAAADIRTTFARMAMNDEETVALIAGGHAFGKTHGAGDSSQVGVEPEGDDISSVGLGWRNSQGKGHSEDTIGSGLEITWTPNPIRWDNDYLRLIYKYEWEMELSPAGAKQWVPINCEESDMAPHAHLESEKVVPRMATTDLALRFGDEKYAEISKKFLDNFDYFTDAFARAWFKLTHRDMGPVSRYFGPEVPKELLIWQDPIPKGPENTPEGLEKITEAIDASDLTVTELVKLAWASASSFRNTDKRGGANGSRIRLEPQISWEINEPDQIKQTLKKLEDLRSSVGVDISMADLIVFAGSYAVKLAVDGVGEGIYIDYIGGRGDATQEYTDVESFEYLRPIADGFRNWSPGNEEIAERLLIDKAALLGLTPAELTALVGGLRVLGVNYGGSTHGVLTGRVGVLSTDFFVNLLSNDIAWAPKAGQPGIYGSHAYKDGERKWTATRADLVFASNSVLRAIAEVFASDDGLQHFVQAFASAWSKVMNADRFDI